MKKGILAYIYDFLSLVFDSIEDINAIILFGSVARGNFSKESDIDLFFDVKRGEKKAEGIILDCINEFEITAEKKWKPRGIENPIKAIVGNLEDKRWAALKKDIITEGIMLYGKYEELPKNLKHCMLFKYELNKKPKEKVRLIRKLFGYKTKKGKKIYKQEGMVQKMNGRKIGNVIIIPIKSASLFFEFLNKQGVKSSVREIWLEE